MKRPISLTTARAQYVHRYTLEHVPDWARRQCDNGKFYAPQYRSDAEWYAATTFPGENGHPRRAEHCISMDQTWPLGQWLKERCPARVYVGATDDARLATLRAELETE